jgi:hypothetical protein
MSGVRTHSFFFILPTSHIQTWTWCARSWSPVPSLPWPTPSARPRWSGLGSSHRPSCYCWSPSRGYSPLPRTRSSGQGTWLYVCAEPSLAQGVGDQPDERRGGLCSAASPPPGPVRPSGWCWQGNDMTWGRLSRCGDGFYGTVMTSTTRRRQRWCWPAVMASTARRRPAAASTSGNGFHVTVKASGGVD